MDLEEKMDGKDAIFSLYDDEIVSWSAGLIFEILNPLVGKAQKQPTVSLTVDFGFRPCLQLGY